MPLTPFHFGPGFVAKACAPGRFWLSSFVVANVLIDLEVLYFLYRREPPLHRDLHTYVGGVGAGIVAAVAAYCVVGWWSSKNVSAGGARWRSFLDALVAGLVGGVSHVLLDSCMHHDMHPWWPFASGNALAGVIGVGTLHMALALSGLFGMALWWLEPKR